MRGKIQQATVIAIHNDEQDKIEDRLAKIAPESLSDACRMLDFMADMQTIGKCMGGHGDVNMMRNIKTGLRAAWKKEMEAAREQARLEGFDRTRRILDMISADAQFSREAKAKAA